MDGEIWRPHPVMNHSLSVVPLLEVIGTILLMSRVNPWGKLHQVHEFSLLETLVYQKIVLLMHGTVATLARPLEDFESPSESTKKFK
jgi:hypothetical protein